jgi:hypothetical protein
VAEAERIWDAIFLAGGPDPEFLRITETARMSVPNGRLQLDLHKAGTEGRTVHLFEAPEKLLREFLSTVSAAPVLKVKLDFLNIPQIEALLLGSPVRKGLLERSDFTGDLPRFELTRISTVTESLRLPLTLPQLELGYEKGGMSLYNAVAPTSEKAMDSAQIDSSSPAHTKGKKAPPEPPKAGMGGGVDLDPVLVIFQRLFRSFRKKAVDCIGSRWEDALRSATGKVRFLSPEFQADTLTPSTAPQVLDLILEVVASAPLLKRSRLRESALLLIADIYDKHYDLLESRGLVDRVEQVYLRLKK